mmetsp:Transcript_22151/g.33801  ORF Transcript_22151/g.33801 Transcript_22151/m.33801 type:complete len:86 (+) Transcript_22151:505-762(+)
MHSPEEYCAVVSGDAEILLAIVKKDQKSCNNKKEELLHPGGLFEFVVFVCLSYNCEGTEWSRLVRRAKGTQMVLGSKWIASIAPP